MVVIRGGRGSNRGLNVQTRRVSKGPALVTGHQPRATTVRHWALDAGRLHLAACRLTAWPGTGTCRGEAQPASQPGASREGVRALLTQHPAPRQHPGSGSVPSALWSLSTPVPMWMPVFSHSSILPSAEHTTTSASPPSHHNYSPPAPPRPTATPVSPPRTDKCTCSDPHPARRVAHVQRSVT